MLDAVCFLCLGGGGSCHLCGGTGRLLEGLLYRVIGWVWATPGCACDACKRVGPGPA